MRKCLIFVIAACLNYIPVQSQHIEKIEFRCNQIDITASTNRRLDNNGKPCVLIKVITTEQNLSFEGNIVGQVLYKTNEYWVYVSSGTKYLKIKSPHFLPALVRFEDYNIIGVISNHTYELVISKQQIIEWQLCERCDGKGLVYSTGWSNEETEWSFCPACYGSERPGYVKIEK